jgi:hypothetical protein
MLRQARLLFLTGIVALGMANATGALLRGEALASASPSVQPSGALTVSEILARMSAARQGLISYSVPIHFNLVVHKGLSVSAQLDAVRYFESPDKEVLVMNSMPSIAKQFRYIYSGLGTPQTWPSQYDISLVPDQSADSNSYELKGVPKTNSNVSYVLLDVTRDTLTPIAAHWFYTNGGQVTMGFQNAPASGGYVLPTMETIDISFPEYKVHATGHYGPYVINQPIPDSIWETSPQPLPT